MRTGNLMPATSKVEFGSAWYRDQALTLNRSAPKWDRRAANDDGQWAMGFVTFDPHRDPQSLPPGTFRQFLDFFLPTEELALTVLGVQKEALEVTEAIEDQARDLAGERSALFSFRLGGPRMLSGEDRLKCAFTMPAKATNLNKHGAAVQISRDVGSVILVKNRRGVQVSARIVSQLTAAQGVSTYRIEFIEQQDRANSFWGISLPSNTDERPALRSLKPQTSMSTALIGSSSWPEVLVFDWAAEGINSVQIILKPPLVFGVQTDEFNSHANSRIASAH
jgi:hypothetical protein